MKLLVQLVEAAVTDGTEGHKGIFEIQHDSVWYIPRAHLFKQQDTILEQFADSTLKSLSYSALTELDPDRRDGRQVITDRFQQEGVLLDSITVSRPFFEKILEHVEEEIRERGYAAPDVSTRVILRSSPPTISTLITPAFVLFLQIQMVLTQDSCRLLNQRTMLPLCSSC